MDHVNYDMRERVATESGRMVVRQGIELPIAKVRSAEHSYRRGENPPD